MRRGVFIRQCIEQCFSKNLDQEECEVSCDVKPWAKWDLILTCCCKWHQRKMFQCSNSCALPRGHFGHGDWWESWVVSGLFALALWTEAGEAADVSARVWLCEGGGSALGHGFCEVTCEFILPESAVLRASLLLQPTSLLQKPFLLQ